MDNMSQLLKGFVEQGKAAGVSALVTQNGHELYFDAFGRQSLDGERPFQRDTLVRMYSTSKVATAAAILTLYDQGAFALDQPISDFLSEYREMSYYELDAAGKPILRKATAPITFRNLFTMTSGIPYPSDDESDPIQKAVSEAQFVFEKRCLQDAEAGKIWDTEDFARALGSCPLVFNPGANWRYGLSIDVLGGLIETISGMEIEAYMKKALFEPLGMVDTGFSVPEEKRFRKATIYTDGPDGLIPWESGGLDEKTNIRFGGAGLYSTVDDYSRFARMLLNKGALEGTRVLKEATVKEMMTPQLDAAQKRGYDWGDERGYVYGLAGRVMVEPSLSDYDECPGAYGWNGLAGTSLRVDPARGTTAIFFIQRVPPNHGEYLPAFSKEVARLAGGK